MTGRGERFLWERALLADRRVGGVRLAVLLTLATHYDRGTERVSRSEVELHEEAGVGVATVRRALTWARENGYLDRVVRGYRVSPEQTVRSAYRLTLPLPLSGTGPLSLSGEGEAHRSETTDPPLREDNRTAHTVTPTAPCERLLRSFSEDLSEPPSTVGTSEEESAMRDYPVDSADRAEREEAGDVSGEPASDVERAAARDLVETFHPTLNPGEVDDVLALIAERATFGLRGARNRELRDGAVADVLARRKRAGDGTGWYAALTPADLSAWEQAARQQLAAEGDIEPSAAVLRARVIRLGWRDRPNAAAVA